MEKTGWKITALISLSIIFLMTIAFVFVVNLGLNIIEKEQECINVCNEKNENFLYWFDETTNLCECYDHYDNLKYSKYIII